MSFTFSSCESRNLLFATHYDLILNFSFFAHILTSSSPVTGSPQQCSGKFALISRLVVCHFRFIAFKTQISSLLGTLVAEDGTPMSTPRGSVIHRLRFRKLGIAVLAANRLQRLGRMRRSFSVRDGERQSNIICWMTADCAGNNYVDLCISSLRYLV